MYLYTFESRVFIMQRVMTIDDASRFAAHTESRISAISLVERVGKVEVDDMHGIPIFGNVWKTEDGRLILDNGTKLTKWQKEHILPIW